MRIAARGEDQGVWAGWLALGFACAGILLQWGHGRWAISVYQIGILLTLLAWCWWMVSRTSRVRIPLIWLPLALVSVWATVQSWTGITVYRWVTGEKCVEWAVHACSAWLVAQAATSEKFRSGARLMLVWFGGVVAAEALLQFFTSQGKVYWLFDSGYSDRVLGPFVYHNKYAQFAELLLPLALYQGLSRRAHSLPCLGAGATLFAGVVAGGSRAGVTLAVLEIPLVLWLARGRGVLRDWNAGIVVGVASSVLVLGGMVAGWGVIYGRLTGIDPLSDVRFPLMSSTWEMILARPWTGSGLGTWPVVYPEFASFDNGLVANQAHCDWLQWLAEGGAPLLLIISGWVALLWRRLLNSVWGVGLLVVLAHAAVDYPFQQLPAFATLLICVAMIAAQDEPAPR